jgi:hypothetical protein
VGAPETDGQISLIIIMSQFWERHHERSCNLNQCGEYNLIHNRNFTCAGRVERLCSIVRTNSCIVQFTSEPLARTECMTISHIAFSSNFKNRFIQDGVVTYRSVSSICLILELFKRVRRILGRSGAKAGVSYRVGHLMLRPKL